MGQTCFNIAEVAYDLKKAFQVKLSGPPDTGWPLAGTMPFEAFQELICFE